jgi:catechol 2,3-dioxygenase-like lactoylglutathione lyase family enzyme
MPLGDPMGGDTQYDNRGFLLGVSTVAIPVRDLAASLSFYEGTLGLSVRRDNRSENWVELGPIGDLGRIALYVPDKDGRRPGGPTGIILKTESIYDLHRKLMDRGVRFAVKPEKRRIGGLIAIFLDQDNNQIAVVEETVITVPQTESVNMREGTEATRPKRPVTEY